MAFSGDVMQMKQDLIEDITSYMKYGGAEDEEDADYDPDFNAGYTQEHIDQCVAAVDRLLADLDFVRGDAAAVMEAVKAVVIRVNDINDACDGSMIETEQREQLCDLIITAAHEAGSGRDDDVTEEWREW